MGIKSIEYKTKWEHHLWLGRNSNTVYVPRAMRTRHSEVTSPPAVPCPGSASPRIRRRSRRPAEHECRTTAGKAPGAAEHAVVDRRPRQTQATVAIASPEYLDPNAGTADAAKIRPRRPAPAGPAPTGRRAHRKLTPPRKARSRIRQASPRPRQRRTYTFFQIYFLMTGLHGIHVLVGMALIFWILVRALPQRPATAQLLGLASIGVFFLYLGIILANTPTLVIGIVITLLAIFGSPIFSMVPARRVSAATTAGEFGPDYFARSISSASTGTWLT